SVNVTGPPETVAAWLPDVPQTIENQDPVTFTGSLNVTEIFALTETSTAPLEGVLDCTTGAWSPAVAVPAMSSPPTRSSLPTASVVMILSWTRGWFHVAAGSETFTGVTSVARLGPVVASATKPAGRLVYEPVEPTRYWSATG